MARPKVEIDWAEFDKLCAMHCTLEEIAGWFKCSEDTIERAVKRQFKKGFAEIHAKKRAAGKISLRRKMLQTALNGNVTMMIWLSKQWLGYRDKQEVVTKDKARTITLKYQVGAPAKKSEGDGGTA